MVEAVKTPLPEPRGRPLPRFAAVGSGMLLVEPGVDTDGACCRLSPECGDRSPMLPVAPVSSLADPDICTGDGVVVKIGGVASAVAGASASGVGEVIVRTGMRLPSLAAATDAPNAPFVTLILLVRISIGEILNISSIQSLT